MLQLISGFGVSSFALYFIQNNQITKLLVIFLDLLSYNHLSGHNRTEYSHFRRIYLIYLIYNLKQQNSHFIENDNSKNDELTVRPSCTF